MWRGRAITVTEGRDKASGGAVEVGGGVGQGAVMTQRPPLTQTQRGFQGVTEMMPPCLPFTAEFQKRECRGYLGVNLKFMTSARSTVPESVTQQVCRGWP